MVEAVLSYHPFLLSGARLCNNFVVSIISHVLSSSFVIGKEKKEEEFASFAITA
jgi:hypothetical protein